MSVIMNCVKEKGGDIPRVLIPPYDSAYVIQLTPVGISKNRVVKVIKCFGFSMPATECNRMQIC